MESGWDQSTVLAHSYLHHCATHLLSTHSVYLGNDVAGQLLCRTMRMDELFPSRSQIDCCASNVRCTGRRSLWLNLLAHLLRHSVSALQRCKTTRSTAARPATTACDMINAGPRCYSETLNVMTPHCAGARLVRRASCPLMLMHVVDQAWFRDYHKSSFRPQLPRR